MGLRDQTIDIIHEPPPFETLPCKLILAVIDATDMDDDTRYDLLIKKLTGYLTYVGDPNFGAHHPGIKPDDILIRVLSAKPPTAAMRMINAIKAPNHNLRLRVVFDDYHAYMAKLRGPATPSAN